MWGRWARSSALLVVAALSSAPLSGCYTVTEIQPRELPKLDLHQEGRPPVYVHTVDGDKVPIDGDFKEARIRVGNEWTGREFALQPPFRADSHAGNLYVLRQGRVLRFDPDRISSVEIVQRDGGRTATVLGMTGVAVLAGALIGGAIQSRNDQNAGDVTCGTCGLVYGGLIVGGIVLVVVMATSKSN